MLDKGMFEEYHNYRPTWLSISVKMPNNGHVRSCRTRWWRRISGTLATAKGISPPAD